MISTGTTNHTFWFEANEEVCPCRCGETHRGPYGFYDWAHHECFHESSLCNVSLGGEEWPLAMWPECGFQWSLDA